MEIESRKYEYDLGMPTSCWDCDYRFQEGDSYYLLDGDYLCAASSSATFIRRRKES